MSRNIFFLPGILIVFALTISCDQSDTKYFEDPHSNGLSIFSNTSNNIASAYFNGEAWRTRDRIYSLGSFPSFEMSIRKNITATASDTLIIEWDGYYPGRSDQRQISFYFATAIPKNFRAADLVSFKGRRLEADGISSYFGVRGSSSLPTQRGVGSIYFHKVEIQLYAQTDGNGRIAGLFEANFTNLSITKGRFDHKLEPLHVSLP